MSLIARVSSQGYVGAFFVGAAVCLNTSLELIIDCKLANFACKPLNGLEIN